MCVSTMACWLGRPDTFSVAVIGAYWWRDQVNFGDLLTPLLLERFSQVHAVWRSVADAQLVGVGSVLEHMPPAWEGRWIVGSGRLHEDSQVYTGGARIMALRGPLSARGIPGDYALGDPGLLADELLPELPARQHHLGVLPHWSDEYLAQQPEFLVRTAGHFPAL